MTNELIIYYIAFVQAIFSAFILITLKRKSSSTSLLTILICLLIADIGINLLKISFPETFKDFMPLDATVFAFGPILLLYLRSTLLKTPTFVTTNLLHFLPFIFFLSLSLVLKGDTYSFRIQYFSNTNISKTILILYSSLSYVSILVYLILCMSNISTAKKNIDDYYSFDKAEKMINWFKYLSFITFIIFTIPTLIGIMSVITGNETFDTTIIYIIGYGFICFLINYYIINSHEIFINNENEATFEINTLNKRPSYTKSLLPKETLDKCAEKLVELMEEKKLYLKSDLSLEDVSKTLEYPKHYITQSLNIVLNKNFYLFVNEYRIKEFKARASDRKNDNLTLSGIAFDSGFNSKSTFNNIFKKFTGQTPSEYVEGIRKKEQL